MFANMRRGTKARRTGLTLPELLVAILIFGSAGAVLLPYVVTSSPPRPTASEPRLAAEPPGYEDGDSFGVRQLSERGVIGVMLHPYLTGDGYVLVSRPFPGGPAERAGVRPLDVILRVDGASARNKGRERLQRMITNGRPGSRVRLTVRRAGTGTLELRITRGSFLEVFLPGITRD